MWSRIADVTRQEAVPAASAIAAIFAGASANGAVAGLARGGAVADSGSGQSKDVQAAA